MYKNKKILAILPARGGSKGLPNKNILKINGKPLIGWTIEQAKNSRYIDQIVVSTDSNKISQIANNFKINIPFLRPEKFSRDDSPSYEAVLHAINFLEEKGKYYDYVIMLEPTSPLRKNNDIDNSIKILIDSFNNSTLVTVGKIHCEHPLIVKKMNDQGFVFPYIINDSKSIYQRQQADEAFFPYGVAYLSKIETYKLEKTFYLKDTLGYLIERWQNYEIDDIVDFKIVSFLMQEYLNNKK